jgi:hypothetical protein
MNGFPACGKFYQDQTRATGKGDWLLVGAKNRRLMTLLNGRALDENTVSIMVL